MAWQVSGLPIGPAGAVLPASRIIKDAEMMDLRKYWPIILAAIAVVAGYVELRLSVRHIAQEVAGIRVELMLRRAQPRPIPSISIA